MSGAYTQEDEVREILSDGVRVTATVVRRHRSDRAVRVRTTPQGTVVLMVGSGDPDGALGDWHGGALKLSPDEAAAVARIVRLRAEQARADGEVAADLHPVIALAAEVQALSAKAHALELLFKRPDLALELLRVDVDVLAAGDAPKLSLRPEPSDLALRLLPALRAGNADLLIVEKALGHLFSSGEGCDDATVRRVGGGGETAPADGPAASQPEATR